MPALINSDLSKKEFRKNWARLIQKIYNVDPLLCPKCNGQMRIIAFIESPEVIKKILKHIGLWDMPPNHSPPDNKAKHILEPTYIDKTYADNFPYDDYSQVSYNDDYSQISPADCLIEW